MQILNDSEKCLRIYLQKRGYFYKITEDLFEWCARLTHHGAMVNPQFDWSNLDQSNSKGALLYDGADELIGSIAWRIIETDNFMHELETGRLKFDDPISAGWHYQDLGASPAARAIRGRVSSRGGIVSWRKGERISWFMTTIAMIQSLRAECDWNVGQTLESITDAGLAERFYGYRRACRLAPRFHPTTGRQTAMTLVWSSAEEVAEEIQTRSLALESATHDEDLRSVVAA